MKTINYAKVFPAFEMRDMVIPRSKWLETDMTETMRKTFIEYFDYSRLLYSIDVADTELLIIEVNLKKVSIKRQSSFTDLIHRAMPYPILLLENFKNEWYKASIVYSHKHSEYYGRKVVDARSSSAWVNQFEFYSLLTDVNHLLISNKLDDVYLRTLGIDYLIDQLDDAFHSFNKKHYKPEFQDYNDLVYDYEDLRETRSNPLLQLKNIKDQYELLEKAVRFYYDEDKLNELEDGSDFIDQIIGALTEFEHEDSYLLEDDYLKYEDVQDDFRKAGTLLLELIQPYFDDYEIVKYDLDAEFLAMVKGTNERLRSTIDFMIHYAVFYTTDHITDEY